MLESDSARKAYKVIKKDSDGNGTVMTGMIIHYEGYF